MSEDRAAERLALARELERRDIEVAKRLDRVAGSLRLVDDVRAETGRIAASLAAIPEEIEHLAEAERETQAREVEARRELREAEHQLEKTARSRRAGEDAKAAAQRALRRAAVAAADAAATVAGTQERIRRLAADELALRAAGERLAVEAHDLARAVADIPRLSDSGRAAPGGSLREIEEWGARAHAALFVVRGGLENEREQIVLEANALAAVAIGEQAAGSSVILVRKRLEAWSQAEDTSRLG
jgi:chromosome segregation ATPase